MKNLEGDTLGTFSTSVDVKEYFGRGESVDQ